MKGVAAILVQQKSPLALEEIEIPPVKLGQVLVRVICCGICGSQIGEINGVKGPDRYLPHLLGREGTGEVLECGEGVRRVKPGDRVVLHWRKAAGLESVAPVYQSKIGKVNAGWVTAFNEYALVSENRLTPIPRDFSPDIGSLFGCAVTTAFGVINNNARLRIGQSIAIFGAGGIGLNIVQGAAMAGAYPIIAVDLFDNRLELAKTMGATHLINSKKIDAAAEIGKIVGAEGVDVAVDNTGNPQVIETAYRLTNSRGKTVLVGVPAKDSNVSIHTLPLHFEKRLIGSHGGESQPDVDIPRYVRLYRENKLKLDQVIGERRPLSEINLAIERMVSGAIAGRVLIEVGQTSL
jgi:S-(hydroxymethyl)glutathione dehydrogenase/alcohol dehydrogenase